MRHRGWPICASPPRLCASAWDRLSGRGRLSVDFGAYVDGVPMDTHAKRSRKTPSLLRGSGPLAHGSCTRRGGATSRAAPEQGEGGCRPRLVQQRSIAHPQPRNPVCHDRPYFIVFIVINNEQLSDASPVNTFENIVTTCTAMPSVHYRTSAATPRNTHRCILFRPFQRCCHPPALKNALVSSQSRVVVGVPPLASASPPVGRGASGSDLNGA